MGKQDTRRHAASRAWNAYGTIPQPLLQPYTPDKAGEPTFATCALFAAGKHCVSRPHSRRDIYLPLSAHRPAVLHRGSQRRCPCGTLSLLLGREKCSLRVQRAHAARRSEQLPRRSRASASCPGRRAPDRQPSSILAMQRAVSAGRHPQGPRQSWRLGAPAGRAATDVSIVCPRQRSPLTRRGSASLATSCSRSEIAPFAARPSVCLAPAQGRGRVVGRAPVRQRGFSRAAPRGPRLERRDVPPAQTGLPVPLDSAWSVIEGQQPQGTALSKPASPVASYNLVTLDELVDDLYALYIRESMNQASTHKYHNSSRYAQPGARDAPPTTPDRSVGSGSASIPPAMLPSLLDPYHPRSIWNPPYGAASAPQAPLGHARGSSSASLQGRGLTPAPWPSFDAKPAHRTFPAAYANAHGLPEFSPLPLPPAWSPSPPVPQSPPQDPAHAPGALHTTVLPCGR